MEYDVPTPVRAAAPARVADLGLVVACVVVRQVVQVVVVVVRLVGLAGRIVVQVPGGCLRYRPCQHHCRRRIDGGGVIVVAEDQYTGSPIGAAAAQLRFSQTANFRQSLCLARLPRPVRVPVHNVAATSHVLSNT